MMLIVHHESCLFFLSSHVYSTTFHAFHQSEITRWQLWVARRWPKSRKDSTASPCAESHLEAFHGNLSQKTIHSIHEKHQTVHIFHQNHPLGLQIWNQIVSQGSPLASSCLCFCTMYYEHMNMSSFYMFTYVAPKMGEHSPAHILGSFWSPKLRLRPSEFRTGFLNCAGPVPEERWWCGIKMDQTVYGFWWFLIGDDRVFWISILIESGLLILFWSISVSMPSLLDIWDSYDSYPCMSTVRQALAEALFNCFDSNSSGTLDAPLPKHGTRLGSPRAPKTRIFNPNYIQLHQIAFQMSVLNFCRNHTYTVIGYSEICVLSLQ